jgi:hypothetical protein
MSTINPNTWLSLDLTKKGQEQVFKQQLVQYLQNQFSAANLVNLLSNSLTASSMLSNTAALGLKTGDFAFDCKGAMLSVFTFSWNANLTLTLRHLAIGALVFFVATSSGTVTMKMAATAPDGTVYTAITLDYSTAAYVNRDMISAGLSSGASNTTVMFSGATLSGPELHLIGQ